MTNETEINNVQSTIAGVAWSMNIDGFAEKLGKVARFENGKLTDIWLQEKWTQFQKLASASNQFDSETLAKILS